MENTKDLTYLLALGIQEMHSAEEQTTEAFPEMIEKAQDEFLKKTLQEHLSVTRKQVKRLEEVKKLLLEHTSNLLYQQEHEAVKELFSESSGKHSNLGMKGLIDEARKLIQQNFIDKVMDTAVIGSAQKIEHYEIAAYGTLRAYAHQLDLGNIAIHLETTLAEEYNADDILSDLALGGLNEEAEAESVGDEEWMNTGRPTAAESGEITPEMTRKSDKQEKKKVPSKAAGTAKAKRPSANVKSPGGRAGTSHRERPGH